MFRRYIPIILSIWLIVSMMPAPGLAQKLMSVQVKTAQLRSTPSFLGKIVATVAYTKQVEVSEKQGEWLKVTVPGTGVTGWIHSSALTKKKLLLSPGASDVSQAASSDEIALAGKGFNADVEKEFKIANRSVDYDSINKMESIVISQQQIEAFLQQGGLFPGGGTP